MATQTKRKQHLNVNATQMEIPPAGKGISEDFEGKLEDAQAQLEYLHKQREQLERQKTALEERRTKVILCLLEYLYSEWPM